MSPESAAAIKKRIERHYLEEFLESSSLQYDEIVEGKDLDSEPDFFLLLKDGTKIAIEMTQVFVDSDVPRRKGSRARTRERLCEQKLNRITEKYYAAGFPAINVYFMRDLPQDEERCVAELGHLALTSASEEKEDALLSCETPVQIRKLPDSFGRYFRWTHIPTHIAWVKKVDRHFLKPAFEAKHRKLAGYKEYCSNVYLVIYAERTNASGAISLMDQDLEIRQGTFTRAFIYLHPGECHEFKICERR